MLIYQDSTDVQKVAEDFPQFNVILRPASDALPPLLPVQSPGNARRRREKTLIVESGTRGSTSASGAFKQKDGSLVLNHQLVLMGEEHHAGHRGRGEENKVLGISEDLREKDVKLEIDWKDYPWSYWVSIHVKC